MQAESRNMKLLAQHDLGGFGAVGEGMSMQLTPDGRRILWLAHESAPKNFSGIDVTDPRAPRMVAQANLPHTRMRSNSLETVGDMLVVAYQTSTPGLEMAGFEVFDIGKPESPRRIGFHDLSGPRSRGCHQLWFVDGETVHLSGSCPDLVPRDPRDDQVYQIVSVKDPARPRLEGRWWLPGTMESDVGPAPSRVPAPFGTAIRVHNTNVWPQRPDRAYVGYLDAGAIILDIGTHASPHMVSQWRNAPPMKGFTHTVLPLFGRDLAVVADESIRDGAEDWPKLLWVLDISDERHPLPISTCQVADPERYFGRGGRFGAHNLYENYPHRQAFKSERYVIGTFFNGGVRVFDLADPFRPVEVAWFVPPAPHDSPIGAVQINDVYVDDRGIVYAAERLTGGVYILEWRQ